MGDDEDGTDAAAIGEAQRRLMTALEHERFSGPVRAAHYAGERAYQIARTRAEKAGTSADAAHACGKRAFWVAYFTDLAEEAAARAAIAWEEMRVHGDEGDSDGGDSATARWENRP